MNKNKRNSLICPKCHKLISSDEQHCPYCGLSSPGSRFKNISISQGIEKPDVIIKYIIYVNIGLYLLSLLLSPRQTGFSFNPLNLFSPESGSLLVLGATGTLPIDRYHRWWTLLTANYLHGSILHIIFNMLAFYQLASIVIREFGAYRMFIIYTLSGVGGFFISYLAGISFTIGASASVCGLMGAILYYGKDRGGIYGQTLFRQMGGWAISIFLFGFMIPGINNWGHAGGIIIGALIAFGLGYKEKNQEGFLQKSLAFFCLIATLLALSWAAFTGIFYRLVG